MPQGVSKRRRRWKSYNSLETSIRSWRRRSRNRASAGNEQPSQATHHDAPVLVTPDVSNHIENAEPMDVDVLNAHIPIDNDDGIIANHNLEHTATDEDAREGVHEQSSNEESSEEDTHSSNNGPVEEEMTMAEALTMVELPEDNPDDDVNSNVVVDRSLKKAIRLLLSGRNMGCISVVTGTNAFKTRQYETMRSFMNEDEVERRRMWPSYNTVLYTLYPALVRHCFAPQLMIHEDVNVKAAGVTPNTRRQVEGGGTASERVLITFPSSWMSREACLLRSRVLAESQKSQSPGVCNFFECAWEKHGNYLNGFAVLSEMGMRGTIYVYGSYIYPRDCIEVSFRVRDRTLRLRLQEKLNIQDENGEMKLIGRIGESQMKRETGLGHGLGDVVVRLLPESNHSLHLELHFHAGITEKTTATTLKISSRTFESINARVRSLSISSRAITAMPSVAPAIGTLEDGRKYVKVPYILFSDDFTSMGGRGGSYGGCYLAPMLSEANRRRSMSNVRILGLTPPGVSSNRVLRNIVDDVVECVTKGVEVSIAGGESLVMFMEVVAYVGDYPGMSHCLDVLGQNANVPCTHCLFIRADLRYEDESSRYAYSTAIHSADPSFRRTKARMRAIRSSAECTSNMLRDAGLC